MKLNKKNTENFELIARYLAGEMNGKELENFEKELVSSPEKSNIINAMKKNWTQIGEYNEKKVVDANKAWDKLHARLNNDSLIPANQRSIVFSMPIWLKYAASIMLVLVLGFVATLYLTKNPAENLVNLQTGNEVNTLVQTLSDGSVVYVASNSTFSYPQQFGNDQRKVMLKGEAFFDIAQNPNKPFIIETEKVIIEVLGTAFNVKTDDVNRFELTVERGKVRVTMKDNMAQSDIVLPGEKVTSNNNHLEKVNIGSYKFAWQQQRIMFKDETLGNIISVINKNYNSNIIIQSEELKNKRLTVTFYNNSLAKVTELICTYLNLKSEITPDSSIIITPNSD